MMVWSDTETSARADVVIEAVSGKSGMSVGASGRAVCSAGGAGSSARESERAIGVC